MAPIISPKECKVMISFNNATAGEDGEALANYLTEMGHPTFCTRLFCPENPGSWHDRTKDGVANCQYFIPLVTNGWQKSIHCKEETKWIEGRVTLEEVTVIPVWYNDFDPDYDKEKGHHYKMTWSGIQSVKRSRETWMLDILRLLPHSPVISRKTKTYSDGATYEGGWKEVRHGHGRITYSDGATYEGNWEDNKRSGKGTITYNDGAIYIGEWLNDKRHGRGTITYEDGAIYIGEWLKDKRHGSGKIAYKCGGVFEGNWESDGRQGEGLYTYADGRVWKGVWEQNEWGAGHWTIS